MWFLYSVCLTSLHFIINRTHYWYCNLLRREKHNLWFVLYGELVIGFIHEVLCIIFHNEYMFPFSYFFINNCYWTVNRGITKTVIAISFSSFRKEHTYVDQMSFHVCTLVIKACTFKLDFSFELAVSKSWWSSFRVKLNLMNNSKINYQVLNFFQCCFQVKNKTMKIFRAITCT